MQDCSQGLRPETDLFADGMKRKLSRRSMGQLFDVMQRSHNDVFVLGSFNYERSTIGLPIQISGDEVWPWMSSNIFGFAIYDCWATK